MHTEAWDYVTKIVAMVRATHPEGVDLVVELGAHNWNGTVRSLFDDWANNYLGLDLVEGEGVDIVANAATHTFIVPPDVIISTELLEHTPEAGAIVDNVGRNLKEGGMFIATMAGPGRNPHASDGSGEVRPGEWYCNIHPRVLTRWLKEAAFTWYDIDYIKIPGDTRCFAIK